MIAPKSQRPPRPRRLWIAALAGAVLLVAVLGITVLVRWLLSSPEGPPPALPAALSTILKQWPDPILVPTLLPTCLAYAPGGASVVADDQASGARALRIALAPRSGAGCPAPAVSPDVVLTEAPALDSLTGAVSTVSFNRLQLARIAQPGAGDTSRVTLQWHCFDMMCRLTGTTSAALTESNLIDLATSVAIAIP